MRSLLCLLAIQLSLRACSAASFSCPEDIGAALPSCQSCGGEDTTNAGHCKNKNPEGKNCGCDKNASGSLITSVVTATQSDKTATGTYALETITSLTSLRQSITTTITATPTTPGGAAKTAVAVVLAGGVAWWLASAVGDAAVVEAALEAPEAPEGHKDDNQCPNPENKCSDCGGVGGLCVTKDGGCRCEEKSCPATKPSCDDQKCKGDQGKCTIDDLKGCDCEASCPKGDDRPDCDSDECKGVDGKCTNKPKDCECKTSCPDHEMTPFCDDCGGGNNKKCKGNPDQGNKYKDCDCLDTGKRSPPYAPFGTQFPNWKNDYNLPDLTDKSFSDGFEGSPKCDMDKAGQVRYLWFQGLYPQFCDQIKDEKKETHADLTNKDYKAPSKKTRSLKARTPPPSSGDYDGFKFSFDWKPKDGTCWKKCGEAFNDMTTSPCGHTAGEMNIMAAKTEYDIGCGTYSYEITPKEKEPEAPPEKNCEPTDSNFYMSQSVLMRNIGEFCDLLNTKGPVRGGTNHGPETYNKGTMDQVDFSAHWDGGDSTLYTEVNKDKCKDALSGFINGCNVPTGKKTQYGNAEKGSNSLNFKHGGTYKEAGITYKIAPTAKRHTPVPDDARGLGSCVVWYKGLWDTFDIWGYGMASSDYGKDVLLPKIKSCGAVTQWEFTYNTDGTKDADWPTFKGAEWYAKGRLPIGPQMWSCVGDALSAAGQEGAGSCAGQ